MANAVNQSNSEAPADGFTDAVWRRILRRFNDKARRELRKLKRQQ